MSQGFYDALCDIEPRELSCAAIATWGRLGLLGWSVEPTARIIEDGSCVQFSWTTKAHHASVDIYADGGDWFFRDRVTGRVATGDYEEDIEALVMELQGMERMK